MVGQLTAVVGNGRAPAQLNLTHQRPLIGGAARLITLSPVLGLPYQLVMAHLVTAVVDLAGLPCGNVGRFRICGAARASLTAFVDWRDGETSGRVGVECAIGDGHREVITGFDIHRRAGDHQGGAVLAGRRDTGRHLPLIDQLVAIGVGCLGSDGHLLALFHLDAGRQSHHRRQVGLWRLVGHHYLIPGGQLMVIGHRQLEHQIDVGGHGIEYNLGLGLSGIKQSGLRAGDLLPAVGQGAFFRIVGG